VGLLASSPTIQCRIYEEYFSSQGVRVVTPDREAQEFKVMKAIYGEDGIKCGYKDGPQALLKEAANGLVAGGAEVIIAGCTEISLVLSQGSLAVPVVDPLAVVARVAVRLAAASRNTSRGGAEGAESRS
jgi:aspartate racemase